jgi:hypothetical protein
MFCSPDLLVVELWSLPELDPVRLVFSFVVFLLVLFVVGASRRIPRIWPGGMADVGGYPVEVCFIARSKSLGWVFVDRSFSLVVVGLLWFR